MNFFSISCLGTFIFSWLLALFIISKNRKSALNQSWFYVCLFIGMWSLGLWGVVRADNIREATYYQYILDLSAIFIPVLYFNFVLVLLSLRQKKKVELEIFLAISILLSFFSFTEYYKEGLNIIQGAGYNYWINPGNFYFIFPLMFSSLMGYSFYLMIRGYSGARGLLKNQIRYMLVAGVVGFVGGTTNFFPQIFHVYPFGNYFVVSYVAIVAYAIVKYRLMGIRFIVSKIYTYGAIALFSYLFFHLVVWMDITYLGGIYTFKSLSTGVLAAVFFSIIFLPLLDKVQKSSDVIFYKGYNPRRIIKDLAIELGSVINLNDLMRIIKAEFKKILGTDEISIYIYQDDGKEGKRMISEGNQPEAVSAEEAEKLGELAITYKKIVIKDELEDEFHALISDLEQKKIKVISPLILRDQVVGLILLGDKIEQDSYGQEDVEFLEIISAQAAVALENARLYEEIEDFNKNLQKKVEEQTADITEKNERLEKLLTMRSEFLDIASHQLRTPVSVIKGVLSMLQEGSVPPDKVNDFINSAFIKSLKLTDVIDDILQASEMDSDKFELSTRANPIEPLLKDIYDDKIIIAQDKGITLSLELPPQPLPLVKIDPRYMDHVIYNLVNNALQYTPKGGWIKITACEEKGRVLVRVIDNGIGIPPEDMPKLFNKFARAKNAVDAYTDGSGLGLFIIRRILDAHPGSEIRIERTEVDKGTTFAVVLPKA